MIEIQDHQQAMKLANPIVDLEETVRRGINDPLADPRFVMNRINKDYFHLPLVTASRENKELLSYQGFDSSASPGMVSVSGRKLTPDAPMQEQAVKEQVVARTPSIFRPIYQQQLQQQSQLRRPNIFKSFLRKQLQQRIGEKRRAFLLNKERERFVNGDRRTNAFKKLELLKRLQNEKIRSGSSVEKINPLTGLPEDLELSSYGAVASITAVSDHKSHPDSVTVDLRDPKYNGATAAVHEQANPTMDNSKLLGNEQNFIDNNTDLKSFLEADSILREKLSKDGIGDTHALQKRNHMKSHKMRS